MPDIIFGRGAYRRDNGNLPELKLVNMWPEQVASAEGGVALQSVQALEQYLFVGSGEIRGVFFQPGAFGNDQFIVSGTTLYRHRSGAYLTALGTIDGAGPVSAAFGGDEFVITAGQTAYSYNGVDLQAIAFPDGAGVRAVEYAAGLFIYLREGSHRWYWSAVLDGRTVDALSFASAENETDEVLGVLVIGDTMFLAGGSSLEVWIKTGDPLAPFTPVTARSVNRGMLFTGCMREVDNAPYFIGDDAVVYRMAEVPQRVSDHGIEERLRSGAPPITTMTFAYEGHSLFAIRTPTGTFALDVTTGVWLELASDGDATWEVTCSQQMTTAPLFGNTAGQILQFSGGGGNIPREFTGAFPIKGGTVTVDNLALNFNAGAAVSGEPTIEVRTSRDGGRTWGAWKPASLGGPGETRTRAVWRRMGSFDQPGALFHFRLQSQTPLRVSGVTVNESMAGRGR
jgi:hypothetical protein